MIKITRGWPPKRRKEQAERCKKNKPWRFSTGPKSDEGKKRVKNNSLKHARRSNAMIELKKALRMQKLFVDSMIERYLSYEPSDKYNIIRKKSVYRKLIYGTYPPTALLSSLMNERPSSL